MSIAPDAHRCYESFDPLCASTTMTPKEGSAGVAGAAICSGGSLGRERHFGFEPGGLRNVFVGEPWARARFRSRTRQAANLLRKPWAGAPRRTGSRQFRTRWELFLRKYHAKPPFRTRTRKASNSCFEEVQGGGAISNSNPKVSNSFDMVFVGGSAE